MAASQLALTLCSETGNPLGLPAPEYSAAQFDEGLPDLLTEYQQGVAIESKGFRMRVAKLVQSSEHSLGQLRLVGYSTKSIEVSYDILCITQGFTSVRKSDNEDFSRNFVFFRTERNP